MITHVLDHPFCDHGLGAPHAPSRRQAGTPVPRLPSFVACPLRPTRRGAEGCRWLSARATAAFEQSWATSAAPAPEAGGGRTPLGAPPKGRAAHSPPCAPIMPVEKYQEGRSGRERGPVSHSPSGD